MKFHTRAMLTVVTESVLEEDLVELLDGLHIRGWTIVEARGKGEHGERRGTFERNGCIQLEVIADHETAERLAIEIHDRFTEHFALSQWLSEVRVLRAEKF